MDFEITVYTRDGCLWCSMVMQWLKKKKINFFQKDVTDNECFQQEFKEFGVLGFPFTVIRENGKMVKTIEGFNKKAFIDFFVS